MSRTITARCRIVTNNQRTSQRDLFLQDQKRNLEYLNDVLGEINFITETVKIDPREIYSPIVKFVNHEKKAEKLNTLLTIMGLINFRVTPRGKLIKLETILQRNINREDNRRNQHIRRIAKVTPSDVKLLTDLLRNKRQHIVAYLNITKELEI